MGESNYLTLILPQDRLLVSNFLSSTRYFDNMFHFLSQFHSCEHEVTWLCHELREKGIREPNSLGFLQEEDFLELTKLCKHPHLVALLRRVSSTTKQGQQGWARLLVKTIPLPVSITAAAHPPQASAAAHPPQASAAAAPPVPLSIRAGPSALQCSSTAPSPAIAMEKRVHKMLTKDQKGNSGAPKAPHSLQAADEQAMADAIAACWEFMWKYAADSPRGKQLAGFGPSMSAETRQLQEATFRSNSISADTVKRKLVGALRCVFHCKAKNWNPWSLSEWEAAEFVRFNASRSKTGGIRAKEALAWMHSALATQNLVTLPLVKKQAMAPSAIIQEPEAEGLMPTVEMIQGLEHLVSSAPTIQGRCYAGLFVAAVHCSCRSSDMQRSKEVVFHAKTVTGLGRFKGVKHWKRWAFPITSYGDVPWVTPWQRALASANLPGVDFIFNGVTSTMDGWKTTPARYGDLNTAFRALLMLPPVSLSAVEALMYTVHGLKHFEITAATQMRLHPETINDLGHWAPNSTMPRRYNQAKCVMENVHRKEIVETIRGGWRPVAAGMMPEPLPGAPPKGPATRTVNTEQVPQKACKRMGVSIKAAVLACKRIKLEHLLAPSVPVSLPFAQTGPAGGIPSEECTPESSQEEADRTPFVPPLTDDECPIVIRAGQCMHWNGRSGKSLCDLWGCGTPSAPAATAVFSKSFPANWKTLNFCKTCSGKSTRAQSACAIKAVF